jgi:hypothetical protein
MEGDMPASETSDRTGKQESQTQFYDAPIVAPNLSDDVLGVIARTAYGVETSRDDQHVTYTIASRGDDSFKGEVRVTHKKTEDGSDNIEVSGTPALGLGVTMSIEGPIEDWMLAQTVDDHNLLTELVYNGQSVLSIYGPTAKLVPDGIALPDGIDDDNLLIPPEHRV